MCTESSTRLNLKHPDFASAWNSSQSMARCTEVGRRPTAVVHICGHVTEKRTFVDEQPIADDVRTLNICRDEGRTVGEAQHRLSFTLLILWFSHTILGMHVDVG